ncbi:MAG: DUF2061 domain-containing protein [Alphaproteobacteria bacterium]|nr:DUF2061 domain-containing protein [Alphaproteobacteria bacterium]
MTKTISFAVVHFAVAFSVAYLLTGSVAVGGLVALVEPLCNTVAYHFHEKAWALFGRKAEAAPTGFGHGHLSGAH